MEAGYMLTKLYRLIGIMLRESSSGSLTDFQLKQDSAARLRGFEEDLKLTDQEFDTILCACCPSPFIAVFVTQNFSYSICRLHYYASE